jgi:hypothetical protein
MESRMNENQLLYLISTLDEDKVGPVVLAVMLASAITVNFAVKLYDIAT